MNLFLFQNFKSLFFLLFFLYAFALNALAFTAEGQQIILSNEEKLWIASHDTVHVGGGPDWAPFDFVDKGGNYSGIANDYIKLISKKTGLNFDVTIDKWSNNLQKMKENKIDLLGAIYYTDKRATYMNYTQPYFEMLDYFFVRDDLDVVTIEDLNGKRVAMPRGYAHRDILKKEFPDIKIVTVETFSEAIDAVLQKRADILFDTYASLSYVFKKEGINTIIPFQSYRGHGMMKLHMSTHKNNPILVSIIDKGLDAITNEEKKEIYTKWFGKNFENSPERIKLTKAEKKWLVKNPIVTFTGDHAWLPFEAFDTNGNHIGIVADYLKEIEKKIAVSFKPKVLKSWNETLQLSKTIGVDVVSGDIDDAVLAQNYIAVTPYIKTPIVIVMDSDHEFVNDLEDIKDKKIAIVKGYGYTSKIYKNYGNISFIEVENAQKALDGVLYDQYDAVLLSMPAASYLIKTKGLSQLKVVGKTSVMMQPTLFVHKDKPILHKLIEKAMNKLSHAKNTQILGKWQNVEFAKQIDYTLAYQLVGLFGFFLLGTLYWNRKLTLEIKERQRIETSLKLSQLQTELLIDNIPLNVVVSRYDGKILRANAQALKEYNVKSDELDHYNVMDFYEHQDDRDKVIDTIKSTGHVKQRIVSFKQLDGSIMQVMLSVIPIEYDLQKALLSISVDMTERIEMEHALTRAKDMADAANQSKSEFLANMSHEIRTPMNAIIGFTELLSEQVRETRLKSYVKTIQNASNTLLTLINDILDLSKIEAGKLLINKTSTNLFDLSDEVSAIFMMSVRNKGLDLIVDVDEKIPKSLLIDEIRLRQILVNLIGNAVKFTQHGYVKLKMRAFNIDEHQSKLDLQIAIKDSGCGIPEDQLHRIFVAFEQKEGQDNRKFGGTGLGLSISKRLSEMMNGKISVESSGKGTTFCVYLFNVDISSVQLEKRLQNELAIDARTFVFKPAKILIADDVDDNRDLIVKNFQESNIEVVSASNGLEAIEQFKIHQPDLILMDIRMPKMDGYEAALQIKKISNVPIIALTASVMKDEHERLKREDFDGYLRKPVLRHELFMELSHFLAYDEVLSFNEEERILLSEKAKANMDLILKVMSEEIAPLRERVLKSNNISEIKKLASLIRSLSHQYDVDVLERYAAQLYEALDTFDIAKMQQLLREYTALEEKIAFF